jgi:hypothetical protein
MRFFSAAVLVFASAEAVSVTKSVQLSFLTRAPNPCAEVAASVQLQANQSTVVIQPSLALACLNDVPLDVKNSIAWLESVRPFLQFQSTLGYLKNPGNEYLLPAVDILGSFDNYISGISSGMFKNQYALEYAVTNLINSAHDGHFSYLARLSTNIFIFARTIQIVSVASTKNGSSPSAFLWSDLEAVAAGASFKPSPISTIDGQDVASSLRQMSSFGNCQDPDALYNQLMHNMALDGIYVYDLSAGIFGGTVAPWMALNDTTKLEFANKSNAEFPNQAILPYYSKLFANISSGADVYKLYTDPELLATGPANADNTSATGSSAPLPSLVPRSGFPLAVARTPDNYAAAYYLPPDSGLSSSVAVLSVPSFYTEGQPQSVAFQSLVYEFLANATSQANKTRLIIDLTGNAGGDSGQGYSMFKNFFPDLVPYQTVRARAISPLNGMGTIASKYINPYPYISPAALENIIDGTVQDVTTLNLSYYAMQGYDLNYRNPLNASTQRFSGWPELFGPHSHMDDNFTSLFQTDYSDPLNFAIFGIEINGFNNRTNMPPARPFKNASDIVILTDGICASTCSLFVDLMRELAGVRVVTVGGRPNDNASMAAVGGTRGARAWSFAAIVQPANASTQIVALEGTSEDAALLNTTGVSALIEAYPLAAFRGTGSVNSRDLIKKADQESGVPAQFRYDPADCRIWYTMESVVNPVALWKDVAAVAWGGEGCIGEQLENVVNTNAGTRFGLKSIFWWIGIVAVAGMLL